MEELNNRQVVLLTMFVSFVVSIATGIITVAMLQEAPPTLTQTVNRVVEHTIERVVSGTTTERVIQVPVTTATKEQPNYQNEDDMIVSAVQKNQNRLVSLWQSGIATTSEATDVGVLVSRDGVIAVVTERFSQDAPKDVSYNVQIGDEFYVAKHMATSSSAITYPVTFLKIETNPSQVAFDPVTFLTKSPQLGQSIVVIGNSSGVGVFRSSIARFTMSLPDENATTSPKTLSRIYTNPELPTHSTGSLAVNLDGQAVGIIVPSDAEDPTKYFIFPVARILLLINSFASGAQ